MGTPHCPRVVTEKGWGRALICGICPFCGLNNPAMANFKQLRCITNLQKSWICSICSSSKPARTGPDTSQDAPSSAPQGPRSPALLRVLALSTRWQQDGSSCSYYHIQTRQRPKEEEGPAPSCSSFLPARKPFPETPQQTSPLVLLSRIGCHANCGSYWLNSR